MLNGQPELPAGPAELTPSVLNALLSERPEFADAEISHAVVQTIGTGRGLVGEVVRVDLTFSSPNSNAPSSIVAKLPSQDAGTREWGFGSEAYEHEYLFYRDIGPECGLPIPECYFAGFDAGAQRTVLLLEDLSGYQNPGLTDHADFELARQVVTAQAGMHARWWNQDIENKHPWLRPSPTRSGRMKENILGGAARISETDESLWPPGVPDIMRRFANSFEKFAAKNLEPPTTLVQGDSRLANVMFRYNELGVPELKFVDFGGVRVGKGVINVAYFLATALTPEDRRESEERLLTTYLETLKTRGVTNYDRAELDEDYRWGQFVLPLVVLVILNTLDTNAISTNEWKTTLSKTVALTDLDCGALLD